MNTKSKILYIITGLIIILEFLAVPFKTDSLVHSSFYERLGQDKENYSVLETPGNTDYDFAARDLVWKSIHRKSTINSYDFARVNDEGYTFQRGTPIIRTLLYDIPVNDGDNGDKDILSSSYYDISNDILNYYNIHYIILDHQGLRGNSDKGDPDLYYTAKAYIRDVVECSDDYEDNYLYACRVAPGKNTGELFLAINYSNPHWIKEKMSKNGLQRWADNGAGMKLVNMADASRNSKLSFNVKIDKPLGIKLFLNDHEVYNKYLTTIGKKQKIEVDLRDIQPGENDITFGVYAADGSEIHSDKKSSTLLIYDVDVSQ